MDSRWLSALAISAQLAFGGWDLGDWVNLGQCALSPALCGLRNGCYTPAQCETEEAVETVIEIATDKQEHMACGNIGDKLSESFSTEIFVPDYLPPDEDVSVAIVDLALPNIPLPENRDLRTQLQTCNFEGVARLYHACLEHDRCMVEREISGDDCDNRLLAAWEAKCSETYGGYSPCRAACLAVVNGSWQIMTRFTSNFEPKSRESLARARMESVLSILR